MQTLEKEPRGSAVTNHYRGNQLWHDWVNTQYLLGLHFDLAEISGLQGPITTPNPFSAKRTDLDVQCLVGTCSNGRGICMSASIFAWYQSPLSGITSTGATLYVCHLANRIHYWLTNAGVNGVTTSRYKGQHNDKKRLKALINAVLHTFESLTYLLGP